MLFYFLIHSLSFISHSFIPPLCRRLLLLPFVALLLIVANCSFLIIGIKIIDLLSPHESSSFLISSIGTSFFLASCLLVAGHCSWMRGSLLIKDRFLTQRIVIGSEASRNESHSEWQKNRRRWKSEVYDFVRRIISNVPFDVKGRKATHSFSSDRNKVAES